MYTTQAPPAEPSTPPGPVDDDDILIEILSDLFGDDE